MKRMVPGTIAAGSMALTFGLSVSNAQAAPITINVVLDDPSGVCILMTPKVVAHPGFHVITPKGETLIWSVTNNCAQQKKVGISSFRPKVNGEPIDHPLDKASSALSTTVAAGRTGTFTAKIKPTVSSAGRTLPMVDVYDIEDIQANNVRVPFGDPEIEIP